MAARDEVPAALSGRMKSMLAEVYAAPGHACHLPYRRGSTQTADALRRRWLLDCFDRNGARYIALTAAGERRSTEAPSPVV